MWGRRFPALSAALRRRQDASEAPDAYVGAIDLSRDHIFINTGLQAGAHRARWVHLIWGTLNSEKLLDKEAAVLVSRYLSEYAEMKGVYMKINYVNADHVHALVDLDLTNV
jgi:hypothetical protein